MVLTMSRCVWTDPSLIPTSSSEATVLRPGGCSCPLVAMADLAALDAKLQTLRGLTAGLEHDRVAVGVAVELLFGRLLDGRAALGAGVAAGGAEGVAAGGAEGVEAGGAGLQQAQEQHGAPAPQARQQQVNAGVWAVSNETGKRFSCKLLRSRKRSCRLF